MQTLEHPVWTSPLLPGITFQVALVTPDMAEDFLSKINIQRNLVPERIDRYALDMIQRGWMFTGDPFRFNEADEFIDGQHRAKAIRDSGLPQVVLIIRHLPKEVMRVLDVGLKRTFAHLMQMAQIPQATHVAALTRTHYLWTVGLYGHRDIPRVHPSPDQLGLDPSHEELWSHFGRHPTLVEGARRSSVLWSRTGRQMVSRSTLGLAWMVLGDIDPYKRDEFLGQVVGDIEPTDTRAGYMPVVLGDRLSRALTAKDTKPPNWSGLSIIFRAWNLWVTGERAQVLKRPSSPDIGKLSQPIDPAKWDGKAVGGDSE